MPLHNLVKENTYYDSVSLMVLSSNLTVIPGVKNAAVMMGTDHNKELMERNNLFHPESEKATPNDLIIGIDYENEKDLSEADKSIYEFFNKQTRSSDQAETNVRTFESAYKQQPQSNLAIISVPGRYAKNEASKALEKGLNVLLFSDNVSLKEEIELKQKALEKGLLMMGPDCGTTIINGTALGFANVVKRGNIGFVAAAGTGLQEATVLTDRLGGGVSQAIGTGGRDIKKQVGGMMMLKGIEMLQEDDSTDVIVLISKPPSSEVLKKVMQAVEHSKKKVVACLLGGDYSLMKDANVLPAETLEDAATFAVAIAEGNIPESTFFTQDINEIAEIVKVETAKMSSEQKYVRGLFSGGTLCYEGMLILRESVGDVYSNVALKENLELTDPEESKENTFLDMGEDYFTEGSPHPMIDTRQRVERIKREAKDKEVAVILLDVVLGYGCHENPAEVLVAAIKEAKIYAEQDGRYISFVASICGTDHDPQSRELQEEILQEGGVLVMPSNAQAARLASLLVSKGDGLDKIL